MLKRRWMVFAAVGAVALAAAAPGWSASGKDVPAVVGTLQKQGLSNLQEFDAGAGLRGYVGLAGRQAITVYVLPDGNAIVGTRVDEAGNSLDADKLVELASGPMTEQTWAQLEDATWVRDGDADAPRVVYTFTDTNCPFCHRFWEAARPWVDAGKVQLRHVMVGVIAADSAPKAAAILGADDPGAALQENELAFDDGGITPAADVPAAVAKDLEANQALMVELGFRGTPGIVYEDEDGRLQTVAGMPQGDALSAVMGPR